jgi:hypothetical protein
LTKIAIDCIEKCISTARIQGPSEAQQAITASLISIIQLNEDAMSSRERLIVRLHFDCIILTMKHKKQ